MTLVTVQFLEIDDDKIRRQTQTRIFKSEELPDSVFDLIEELEEDFGTVDYFGGGDEEHTFVCHECRPDQEGLFLTHLYTQLELESLTFTWQDVTPEDQCPQES